MARSAKAAQDYRLHERLVEAYMADRIRIHIEFNRLNRTGSPVFNPWENVVPLLALILGSVAIMPFDLVAGTLVLIGVMFVYAFLVRPWIAQRLRARTIENMLRNAHNWQVIWSLGGIVVTMTANPRIGVVAPGGDWRAFARQFEGGRTVGPGLGEISGSAAARSAPDASPDGSRPAAHSQESA